MGQQGRLKILAAQIQPPAFVRNILSETGTKESPKIRTLFVDERSAQVEVRADEGPEEVLAVGVAPGVDFSNRFWPEFYTRILFRVKY
jgi:hypothetical protein